MGEVPASDVIIDVAAVADDMPGHARNFSFIALGQVDELARSGKSSSDSAQAEYGKRVRTTPSVRIDLARA